MKFHSTNKKSDSASLREAVFHGLAPDGGLFMPERIPRLPKKFIDRLSGLSFHEIALEVAYALIGADVPKKVLKKMVAKAINFDAPLVPLNGNTFVLELFHGPTLAFKDFGARFMAELVSYFSRNSKKEVVILTATSGDTGSAVAQGFFGVPNVKVVVLYPKGRVTKVQESQMATLGRNIQAIEVRGTFDDCQALVKRAFLDEDLNNRLNLTSANSINIARLIPQTFYYFWAVAQIQKFMVHSSRFIVRSSLSTKRKSESANHELRTMNRLV
ncbi:MAG: threonine synthase, partial [Candidatus Liptonbacteria bacterium]|nr:threonine synthase [Candidatus Liptonbacteria bacterium]